MMTRIKWGALGGLFLFAFMFVHNANALTLDGNIETVVNSSFSVLHGTKSASSSVWVDGSQVVEFDDREDWFYRATLTEGDNNFVVETRDVQGEQIDTETINIESNNYAEKIILEPGWNIISTPRVLERHVFSANETSANFDIYVLDKNTPSGWATMQDIGQTEFTPLYGYFVNNKTGQEQYLTFVYEQDLDPAGRIFTRDLESGWNIVGVASPDYAVSRVSSLSSSPTSVFSSILDSSDLLIDFTNSTYFHVGVSDTWLSRNTDNLYNFNTIRETKAYGVFLNEDIVYQGTQDNTHLLDSYLFTGISDGTPAAGNIPTGVVVDFLKIDFLTYEDVFIDGLILSTYDLGDPNNIENISVSIFDGYDVLGSVSHTGSNGEIFIDFEESFLVPASSARTTFTVSASIKEGAVGNYALGIDSAAGILSERADIGGSFPIVGNTKAAVATNLGRVTVANVVNQETSATIGENDVLLAKFDLDTSEEPIIWETAKFKNGGDAVVSNLRIMIDGYEIDSAEQSGDFITFDLDNYLIDKDESINVEIYGDIASSDVEADDTVELYIDNSDDFSLVGQDYGYNLLANIDALDIANEGIRVAIDTGDVTLDIDRVATPDKSVSSNIDDLVIATFTVTSNGTDATLESINGDSGVFGIQFNNLDITSNEIISSFVENIELRNTSGGIYGLSFATSTSVVNGDLFVNLFLDEEISLTQGVAEEFEVRLDLLDTIMDDATIQFFMEGNAYEIETVSGDIITDIAGGGSGSVITVTTPSADWTTKSLTDKSVVSGASNVLVYKGTLEVGDVSNVEISSIRFTSSEMDEVFHNNQINDLELWIGGNKIATKYGAIMDDVTNYIQFNSVNYNIAAGDMAYIELYANFSSSFTTVGNFGISIFNEDDIILRDKDNNEMFNFLINSGFVSRDISCVSTGNLMVELKTDDKDANDDTYILAGSTITSNDKYIGELVFTTESEDIKVETLVLAQNGTATGADYNRVYLYKDGEVVAYDVPNALGHANFDSLDLVLPADESTSLFIGVETKSINADGDDEGTAIHGRTIQLSLASSEVLTSIGLSANEAITAQGIDSGEDIDLFEDTDSNVTANEYSASTVLSNTTIITGSLLTAVESAMDDGSLTGGSRTIGEYTFIFDNGVNRNYSNEEMKSSFRSLTFTVASSSVRLSEVQLYDRDNTDVKVSASSVIANKIIFNDLSALEGVDGEVTLILKATVSIDASADNYYLQTSIADLAGGDFVFDANGDDVGGTISDPLLSWNDVEGSTLD